MQKRTFLHPSDEKCDSKSVLKTYFHVYFTIAFHRCQASSPLAHILHISQKTKIPKNNARQIHISIIECISCQRQQVRKRKSCRGAPIQLLKVSFGAEKLQENMDTLVRAVVKAKPAAAKGQYIRSCTVASTMGPGVKVNTAKYGN